MSDTPLFVETRGADAATGSETFLLVHGFGASSYSWRHWVPLLEARGRVLLVDMKGFGRASKPDDGDYSPTTQAALLDELVARENPEHLTIIGHSLGGGVALLLALTMVERGDQRLKRLVSVAGAAYKQRLPPFVTLARYPRMSTAGLGVIGVERTIGFVLRSIVHDPGSIEPEQVRAYSEPLRTAEGVRAMLDAARQIVPENLESVEARLSRIDVPTLLLWGRGDRVVPLSTGERLARELPHARLEVIEECGHIPHEERPELTIGMLDAFLRDS